MEVDEATNPGIVQGIQGGQGSCTSAIGQKRIFNPSSSSSTFNVDNEDVKEDDDPFQSMRYPLKR